MAEVEAQSPVPATENAPGLDNVYEEGADTSSEAPHVEHEVPAAEAAATVPANGTPKDAGASGETNGDGITNGALVDDTVVAPQGDVSAPKEQPKKLGLPSKATVTAGKGKPAPAIKAPSKSSGPPTPLVKKVRYASRF